MSEAFGVNSEQISSADSQLYNSSFTNKIQRKYNQKNGGKQSTKKQTNKITLILNSLNALFVSTYPTLLLLSYQGTFFVQSHLPLFVLIYFHSLEIDDRAFSVIAPQNWNEPPSNARSPTSTSLYTKILSTSKPLFLYLKSFLFTIKKRKLFTFTINLYIHFTKIKCRCKYRKIFIHLHFTAFLTSAVVLVIRRESNMFFLDLIRLPWSPAETSFQGTF